MNELAIMSEKLEALPQIKEEGETIGVEKYVFQLFVTDNSPSSARAIKNMNTICEKYLKGRYELKIIDINKQPDFALTENIIAIPVLIKKFPLPEERVI